jgi:hypothetical protein
VLAIDLAADAVSGYLVPREGDWSHGVLVFRLAPMVH